MDHERWLRSHGGLTGKMLYCVEDLLDGISEEWAFVGWMVIWN